MCNGSPGWGEAVCLRLRGLLGQVCTHLAAPNSAAVFSTVLEATATFRVLQAAVPKACDRRTPFLVFPALEVSHTPWL